MKRGEQGRGWSIDTVRLGHFLCRISLSCSRPKSRRRLDRQKRRKHLHNLQSSSGSGSTRSTRVSIYLVYLLHETLGKICQNEQELHPHEEIRHRSSIGTGSLVLCLCYRHQSRGQGSHSVCHMWLICNMRLETTSCAFDEKALIYSSA